MKNPARKERCPYNSTVKCDYAENVKVINRRRKRRDLKGVIMPECARCMKRSTLEKYIRSEANV